ncbi:hypothetical protein T492DRAFT_945842 [Pavlovales sp. CCMP2436]|nr:hypothetical protein T492DRAFT_945842 [Pavlovales sp. CCMP2436]
MGDVGVPEVFELTLNLISLRASRVQLESERERINNRLLIVNAALSTQSARSVASLSRLDDVEIVLIHQQLVAPTAQREALASHRDFEAVRSGCCSSARARSPLPRAAQAQACGSGLPQNRAGDGQGARGRRLRADRARAEGVRSAPTAAQLGHGHCASRGGPGRHAHVIGAPHARCEEWQARLHKRCGRVDLRRACHRHGRHLAPNRGHRAGERRGEMLAHRAGQGPLCTSGHGRRSRSHPQDSTRRVARNTRVPPRPPRCSPRHPIRHRLGGAPQRRARGPIGRRISACSRACPQTGS